ncbi:MAG: iron ABC transporter permease [Chloroflexi bacterium]|nr:iron ABC transporter permease [Chloroflexota bacterium]
MGQRGWGRIGALLAAMLIIAGTSLFIGRYPAPYWTSPALLGQDELARRLVFSLRLPRILAALMVGSSLAASGLVFQMVFRNPLVEPGLLGVSQGAAFGAALSILTLHSSPLLIELSAAVFAMVGLLLSFLLARRLRYGGWVLRLILAGIAISALFAAGLGILKYLADPLSELPEITFWLLGGLWGVTWRETVFVLPPVLLGLVLIMALRWRLNLLTLSDETAISLGSRPGRERSLLLLGAVAAVAAVTAVGGIVGWVGLIIPHVARRLFGADAKHALPAAILMGGIFVLLCDNLARSMLAGEIPLGILTSFFGALGFALLMMRTRVRLRP